MKIRNVFALPFVAMCAALCLTAVAPTNAANITPSLVAFKQIGPHAFEVITSWKIVELPPKGYVVFTHIVSPVPTDNGDILTQADSGIDAPETWKAGSTLTSKPIVVDMGSKIADGTYLYTVGMFSPTGGDRLELRGNDDGSSRYVLGKIIVSGHGATLASPGLPTVTPLQEGLVDAWPTVVNFLQTGNKSISFQVSYDVKTPFPAGFETFGHVTILNPDAKHDAIAAGGPADDIATDKWPVGQKHVTPVINITLPDTTPDGTYNIRVGLYASKTDGHRLKLAGTDDGGLRYVVGSIVVSGNGAKVDFKK
ncbi:MAG: hypothetical protein P4L33_01455 [Capsulimonadaceae bacterium]|nr:hypothetical protein [Capsulimonadaceae bacterium]